MIFQGFLPGSSSPPVPSGRCSRRLSAGVLVGASSSALHPKRLSPRTVCRCKRFMIWFIRLLIPFWFMLIDHITCPSMTSDCLLEMTLISGFLSTSWSHLSTFMAACMRTRWWESARCEGKIAHARNVSSLRDKTAHLQQGSTYARTKTNEVLNTECALLHVALHIFIPRRCWILQ